MEYKTIIDEAEDRFIEKKSEFIGYIAPCTTEEQAIAFIEKIRTMHRKATHNCYAYILRDNNISRHSDDGEPGGTAGVPIHEVIEKSGLVDVCVVVTRYFGGILLGAGGLVRAYSKGAAIAIAAARQRRFITASLLQLCCEYPLYGKLAAAFADFVDIRIQKENFTDKVEIVLYLPEIQTADFISKMTDLCNGRITINVTATELFDFAQNQCS